MNPCTRLILRRASAYCSLGMVHTMEQTPRGKRGRSAFALGRRQNESLHTSYSAT